MFAHKGRECLARVRAYRSAEDIVETVICGGRNVPPGEP